MTSRFYLSVTRKSSLCGQQLFPATLRSKWVSSRGVPAPYGVISHRSVPFLSLYTKSAHDIKLILHTKVCNMLFKVQSHDRFPGAIYKCNFLSYNLFVRLGTKYFVSFAMVQSSWVLLNFRSIKRLYSLMVDMLIGPKPYTASKLLQNSSLG